MGLFFRKSFRAGPFRFSLSKSGIVMSTGVKGLRVGTGPRGAYIAGGMKGLYFRQYVGSSKSAGTALGSRPPERPYLPVAGKPHAHNATVIENAAAPRAGGLAIPICLGLLGILILFAGIDARALRAVVLGIVLLACAYLLQRWERAKSTRFTEYESLLDGLSATRDDHNLNQIKDLMQKHQWFALEQWKKKQRFVYAHLVHDAVEGGIDLAQKEWLADVVNTLRITDATSIHLEVIRPLLWQAMADRVVTEAEESALNGLLASLGLSWMQVPEEANAFDQFVRARKIQCGELPLVTAGIKLQKNEVCHHKTQGAFLENRVVRSYTSGGQRHKEEALMPTKKGDIYITSKRILLVGDGTSSIPHEKVLDIEVDQDNKLITLLKDGRQTPLYVEVADAIYTGILIEHLSNTTGRGEEQVPPSSNAQE